MTRHYNANTNKWTFNYEPQIQLNLPPTPQLPNSPTPLNFNTRLYLTTPTGERVGFTFAPVIHQVGGGTYYTPNWVADAGVNYTLASVDAKLMLAGGKFYELETAIPYNPASGSIKGAEYVLTAADGTKYELDAQRGLVGRIAANGTKLIYSDAGIIASTGESVQFVKDSAGNITQVTAPNGTQLGYEYNSQGDLVSVRNSATGELQKYGYETVTTDGNTSERLSVISNNTGGTVINYSGTGFTTEPVARDLGGIANFKGQAIATTTATRQVYSFNLKASELNTASNHTVLIGVEGAGTMRINGMAPVYVQGNYRVFALDKAGINLLDITNPGSNFKLSLVGDLNLDNRVDGLDTQLLTSTNVDLNRDGFINAQDLQLLGGNYGFVGNNAPVITPVAQLTHVDLTTRIDLSKLAVDNEGDNVAFTVKAGTHGRVEISADGQYAVFTPDAGFGGTGGFELIASDGFSSSQANIDVNVSTAALVNLDITNRNPKLQVGDKYLLQIVGDFADQKGVYLPGEYVNFAVNNPVVSIDSYGAITALVDGTGIISISRGGISAVTATRIGTFNPQTDNELNVAFAEQKGLDVYPNTVTLTQGIERKILVGIGNIYQSPTPDLRYGSTGTQYFVSNPNVLRVNADGLITTLQEGFATVTVINGAAEAVIPVQVQSPHIGATVLGKDGGIVQGVDGSLVMVGANALSENTTVNLIPIAQSVFSLPIPTSDDLPIVGSFHLDLGSKAANEPIQLAIPAPAGLAVGTEVAFLRESSYLNESGQWTPAWSFDEIGIVGSDGMIRTQSPPLPGINRTGNYVMAAALKYSFTKTRLEWDPDVLSALAGLVIAGVGVAAVLNPGSVVPVILSLAATLLIPELLSDPLSKAYGRSPASAAALAARARLAGAFTTGLGIGITISALLRNREITSTLKIYQAPPIGLPEVTELGVELNSTGVYQIKSINQLPKLSEINPIAPPVIESAEVKFVGTGSQKNPLLFITGSNFLNGTNNLGDNFQDLVVDFQVGKNTYSSSDIVLDQSTSLGGNRYTIAVKVPTTVALSEAAITLKRRQHEQTGSEQSDFIEVEIKSPRQIWLEQPEVEYALVARRWADRVDLIDLANPQLTNMSAEGSANLLAASIPVTTVGQTANNGNGPRAVASTSDAGRAYVILDGGQVALIDLLTWRRVDGYIPLPAGVAPSAIAIDRQDSYAYVSDSNPNGGIYVIDIQPSSATYNQVIQHIASVSANSGFRDLAINSDGRRLYATSNNNADGKSRIIVIDIDPQQRVTNILQWNRKIAEIETDYQGRLLPSLAGISATDDPKKMIFTQGSENAYGLGYLNVTDDDSAHFTVELRYTSINAVNHSAIDRNYYVLSKAKDAVITRDSKYAFVLTTDGYQQGRGFETLDNRFGTSIGIIKDPLTPNAKLVAATRPIPFGGGAGITISSDDRYISVTNPLVDGVFVYDVKEIAKTIDEVNSTTLLSFSPYRIDNKGRGEGSPDYNPLTGRDVRPDDLPRIPIDDINIKIDTAANYQVIPVSPDGLSETDWGENFVFGAPPGVKNAPIGISGNPRGITTAAHRDWVKLHVPNSTDIIDLNPNPTLATLNPALSWELTQNLTLDKVKEVDLFISVFDRGHGLLPEDTWDTLNIGQDYNPNRILTATWKNGIWSWANSTKNDSFNTFTIPTDRILTAGQDYYWAVRVTDKTGNYQDDFGQFKTKLATQETGDAGSFQSVTILTTGLEYNSQAFNQDIQVIADRITNYNQDGLSLYFEEKTSRWYWLNANNQKQFNIPNDKLGKPLVLIPELQLAPETNSLNSGWAEAAADALFASIVKLDQQYGGSVGTQDGAGNLTGLYDNKGNLIRKQGKVLDSHLHFVGVGQGAVINSEIIQRLGTYFPYAGGATYIDGTTGELKPVTDSNGKALRDLQMTTLDPHDFTQSSLGSSWRVINEPEIKVWSNVTFADNYYQTVGNSTYTRSGRAIVPQDASDLNGADVNVNLNSYLGFQLDNGSNQAHLNTLAWYTGTVNLNLGQIPPSSNGSKIYRRLGDLNSTDPNTTHDETWYSPSYKNYLPIHGSKFAPWEGIGTGWFLSALGGGYTNNLRPNHLTTGVPVSFDNTSQARMRGDYAVPTLFNGNFDVISQKLNQQTVPSWALYNGTGNPDALQGRLVDWGNITSLDQEFQTGWSSKPSATNLAGVPELGTYLGKLGIDPNAPNYQTNYAIRLNSNDELVHSSFVTPDWGDLRLDLEVPNPTGGKLEIWMKASDDPNAIWQELYTLASQQSGPPSALPLYGVDLQKGKLINQVGLVEYKDTVKVGGVNVDVNFPDIPRHGFETFYFKVPDALRGKSSLLKFKLTGSTGEAYLDNVFFKSSHLKLGNPSNARVDEITQSNYLMERSQFSLSYNNNTKIANWVAWQLNGGDLGANSRYSGNFRRDYTLPISFGNNQPVHADYTNSSIDRGHMIASSHQTSTYKDNAETFLLTNVLPQFVDNNRFSFIGGGNSAWYDLEAASRLTVQNSNLELYNFAGGIDIDNNWTPRRASRATTEYSNDYTDPTKLETEGIHIPRFTWKIILGLQQGQGIQDVTTNTPVVAVITPNQAEPYQFYLNPPQLVEHPLRPGVWINRDQWRDWHTWQVSVSEIEQRTGLQFFLDLPLGIRNALKGNSNGNLPSAALLAEDESSTNSTIFDVTEIDDSIQILHISQVGTPPQITDLNSFQVGTSEVGIFHDGFSHRSLSEVGSTEIGSGEVTFVHPTSSQVSITKVSIGEIGSTQVGSTQISSTEVAPAQINLNKKIFISNGTSYHYPTQVNFPEVSMARSVEPPKLVSSHLLHDNTPLLNTVYSTAQTLWHTTTPIDLAFKIQDLPTGQLAEGTITSYNTNGTPKTATITIDDDANGVGWFIDTTPQDNSEFTGTDNYLQATPNSAASGKYDLLTTILHEMGHTLGIINGYSEFDKYVKGKKFITDTFTANLTPDGSHLDTTFHPYDLMNTSLKPGVRKLPSALNLAMIDAINSGVGGWVSGVGTLNSANLTAGALIGITNGDFTTPTTWNTAGATNIINGSATLTEQSQKLSELTQAFIIPTGAKTLQFTIIDNHLVTGDTSKTANDAFEVALLDTNTFNPLAGTSIGLTNTDSLLNIQANGTIHKSDKVTITTLGNNSSIVTIDLTQVTPSTQATLYFNLLGFGARTSTVTIDDVKLFTDTQPIPVTKNDTLTTNQNTPLTLNPTQLTTNDTNVSQIQIINQPTHGTLTQTPDGKLTYQPVSTYVGNDSFTYLGFGSDGQISNLATVNLTVNNLPPTIETLLIPNQINEGQTIQLKATAKDGGSSDNLTYTWDLGDGSQTVIGQNIVHQFVDNGTYNVVLTVTDKDGGTTQQSTQLTVDNVAPTLVVDKSVNTNINQGEAITFVANYSDSGIKDTHTITWNFGDGSNPVSSVNNPSHQFTKAGTNNVTVTVTDNDGASTTDTIQVTVTNVAPTINTVNIPTNINEGSTVQLTATASDAGNDTLTYNWYINGATTPIIGQTIDYNFANSGSYPVKLDVIDSDGAITTQTIDVTVTNVAPTIDNITIPTNIKEGETIQLTATASDSGNDTLTYNWYINNAITPITGQTIDYIFTDNGIYPVKLEVIDTDGAVTTQTVDVTVTNVAPTIVKIVKPDTIKEGERVEFTAIATDVGINDLLTYSWNFGDNTNPTIGQIVSHTFADNGNYNVTLTVTDKDGAATTQTVAVTVANVAPVVVSILKPAKIDEGEEVEFMATATDAGVEDTLTYTWNFGDNTEQSSSKNVNHIFADNGNYNVVLTVTDKDGAVTTQTVAVTVDNVAPVVVSIAKPETIKEGESVTFSATATDPGILDTLTYSWNFGDNTNPVTGRNVTHTYADNGNYNVVLTVTDKDGAVTTQTVVAKVDNVAPTIVSIAKPTTINPNQAATFAATATDAGVLDTLTYLWNFGDNTQTATGQNAAHTFTTAGNYTLTLAVTDKDGATTTTTQQITVAALPTITINDPTITEGDSGTSNLTFTLTLNQASTQAISVNYNTSNLTALSGSDYTATNGTITFNAGETTTTIMIAILGDTTAEATETFALNLTNAINATIAKTQGTATILDNDTIAAPASGIRSGGTVTIKGNADLDGNINSRTDDTKIYAAKGVNFNGNSITLPVKRDAAGNPLKDTNGKIILETGEITIAPGGSTSSLSGKYSGIASATQTITIPTFIDTKQQHFLSKVPSTGVITYDIGLNPIGNTATWNTKFPPAGTATNPTVVRIINGSLSLPANINLTNYIIIVENGNINFNNGTPALNNVTLIANNGNIDLKSVTGNAVSLCASGNINFNGGNQLAGNWLVNSNGNTTFSGSNSMSNAASSVKIVAQGNIEMSGNTNLKGQLWTKKNFSANGSTTIVGAITAGDNVDIQGNSTITG